MTKKNFWLVILAITLVLGMTVIGCNNGSTDDNGNGDGEGSNGRWRIKKYTSYTVTDGEVGSVSSELVYNWITYRYISDTNYEQEYTITSTTGSTTYHVTRNGQNYTSFSESTTTSGTSTTTQTITYDSAGKQLQSTSESTTTTTTGTYTSNKTTTYEYDSASGLTSKQTTNQTTQNYSGTTSTTSSEISYNIQLLSDSGGLKTYRYSYKTLTTNGSSIDISSYPSYQQYTEYKIQNGRTLEAKTYSASDVLLSHSTYDNNGNIQEQKTYSADGVLSSITTYTRTLSDNAVIKAKLGNYTLSSTTQTIDGSTYNSYQTVEVLYDSETELVISSKTFFNNVLTGQTDYTYERVN